MKSIEATGKTKEDAVESALRQLNLKRSHVIVEVLEEGSRRFLGLGGKQVKVKVSEIEEGATNPAEVVNAILEMMGVEFTMDVERKDDETSIRIDAPKDDGLLIGRRGQTLDALRHISQRIIAARSGGSMIVNIDVGDYRARREESLRERAREAAAETLDRKRNVTLDPMSAQDRRVVHMELADHEGTYTFTVGSGNRRRVVIAVEGEKRGNRERTRPESRGEEAVSNNKVERPVRDRRSPEREREPVNDSGEMAYDRVPDPGFRSSRISQNDSGGLGDSRDSSSDRPSRSRSPRSSSGQRSDYGGNERQDGNRQEASGNDQRGGDREHRPRNDRGERRDRNDRPRRDGGRDRGRDHRETRDRGDRRDRYADDHRNEAVDSGPREKAVLTDVEYVNDESGEKAFNNDLAARILQMSGDKKDGAKGGGSRRSRRR